MTQFNNPLHVRSGADNQLVLKAEQPFFMKAVDMILGRIELVGALRQSDQTVFIFTQLKPVALIVSAA
jgi:hypothetical protein